MSLAGVDVSSFQGLPQHWTVAAGSISWAAVKFTEHKQDGSTYVNPDAAADWEWLAQHGKVRVAYTFAHPASSSARTVSAFVAEVLKLGLHDTDGVALDLEVTDNCTAAQVSTWAQDVMAGLHRALGRVPLLYTFLSFAESGNCAGLGDYPLWIADPSSAMGRPRVPHPWTGWAIHQFRITGGIDRDVASWGSAAQMAEAVGKAQPVDHRKTGLFETTGAESWQDIARAHGKIGAAHLLRYNGGPDKPFTHEIAAYINAGRLDTPMPPRVKVRVPRHAG